MLKFYAKPAMSPSDEPRCVPWPNSHFGNQTRRFVARSYRADDRSFPADAEPAQLLETDADAALLKRACQRGGLWPADESTARFCEVPFVALERDASGEWFPKKTEAKAKPSKD